MHPQPAGHYCNTSTTEGGGHLNTEGGQHTTSEDGQSSTTESGQKHDILRQRNSAQDALHNTKHSHMTYETEYPDAHNHGDYGASPANSNGAGGANPSRARVVVGIHLYKQTPPSTHRCLGHITHENKNKDG